MNRKGSKQLFWSFFFIRCWLEFLLSHCQIAAISVRVFIRDIMHNIIVYLPPRLVQSAGDWHRGDLALKDVWGNLGIRKGDVPKSLTRHKQQIFTFRIEEVASLKYLHHNIGPDIDLVCPTSNFLTNIVIESSWMGAIWRPCSIQSDRAKLLFARRCACWLFWHPALTELQC